MVKSKEGSEVRSEPETIERMARREYAGLCLVLPKVLEERVITLLVRAYRWAPK